MATDIPEAELLYFNGINGATGEYGMAVSQAELIARITGQPKPENLSELQYKQQNPFPVKEGVEPTDVAQAGWGVIFAKDADPALKEALQPLLKLRQEQAGQNFRIYEGDKGYQGESKQKFLADRGASPGPADPTKVPYYLLIVGSPEAIGYRFQNQLDVQYAVGRIYFDKLEDYARYAESVVASERGLVKLRRKIGVFGVATPGDKATELSRDRLVKPLVDNLRNSRPDWKLDTFLAEQATHAQLMYLMGGDQTPALLFTASHGMEFPAGDPRQELHQGALLCQDWPGPRGPKGPIKEDWYFAGNHLASDANLTGSITFHFACYGAGTPLLDEYSKQAFKDKKPIAERPFVARLPMASLAHGALASIGHVERAWGYSFAWPGTRSPAQITVFEDAFSILLNGDPVGYAVEKFNLRYAELSSDLVTMIEAVDSGDTVDQYELASSWTSNNDARGYIVLGDPAARLHFVEDGSTSAEIRPVIAVSDETRQKLAEKLNVPPTGLPPLPLKIPAPSSESSASQQAPAFDTMSFAAQVEGERTSLTDSIKKFTNELAASLKKAADDISSLEVITYSTDDLNKVTYDYRDKKLHGELTMRALTRIEFDGDVKVCVPEKDGHIDQAVWDVHLSMVKAAQENRAAFLQTMAELATKLIGLLGGK
jgi:hypothetical protein